MGTPERPLSDLGLRGYLTYWVATLIRFFRCVFSAVDRSFTTYSSTRRLLTVLPPEYVQVTTDQWISDISQLQSSEGNIIRRKRPKGWDGEVNDAASTGSTPHRSDGLYPFARAVVVILNLDNRSTQRTPTDRDDIKS